MTGTRLGHYVVGEPLGKGGMGAVYRGEDLRLGRAVALKFLLPSQASDPEQRARLLREARAASALNHPHIVSLYDIGDTAGSLYMAMELVDGRTLRDTLE